MHGKRAILHLQLNTCTPVGAATEHEVSTLHQELKLEGWGGPKNWYQHIVLKPPYHGLRWRELWVLRMSLLPYRCLIVGPFEVEKCASLVGSRVSGVWPPRSMTDWAMLTVSQFANYRVCEWRVLHLWACRQWDHPSRWFRQTMVLMENVLAQFLVVSCQEPSNEGIKSSQVRKLIPFNAWMILNGVN